MTALRIDGFDHYGTGGSSIAAMLAGAYANVLNVMCEAPPWGPARTGVFCLRQTGTAPSGLFYAVPTAGPHFFASFGFAVDALAIGFGRIAEFRDGSNNVLFYLAFTPTGALQICAANGTQLGISSGPVIVPENWHFIELEVNTGTNTMTVRVDDPTGGATPVLTVTNGSIAGTIGLLCFITTTLGGGLSQIDDLFVRDNNGTYNNAWLGDRRTASLFPDADTATAGWTPRYYQKLGAGILNNTATGSDPAGVTAASSTSLNVGAGDFTIEGFVRFQALPSGSGKAVIFGKWDEGANQRSYQLFLGSVALNGGALCFQTSTDGTISTVAQPVVYPWAPSTDTYYHVALVRASGELLLFVDGQQLGLPIADSNTYFAGSASMGLACQPQSGNPLHPIVGGASLQGWMDEVRFTVGFARYTANFTPTAVEFPRNVGGDPQFADVALLCGFDSLIQDESSFGRALVAQNGATQQTPNDGPAVGVFSTLAKATPDDNTFAEAPFVPAISILTLAAQPAANDTVTVGTKNASTAAVYTFKATLTGAAFEVLIDSSLQQTLQNLFNAINAGPGIGTKYGTGTTANFDVTASQLPAGQMEVTANTAGTVGNSIATSVSLTHGGGWTGTHLAGGTNIPGPSDFKVQRPPPQTTVISAVQITQRAFKSDAGTCSVNSALVGALGGVISSSAHNLTVSPNYYSDVYEEDPDTSADITPSTIINGRIRLNRAT